MAKGPLRLGARLTHATGKTGAVTLVQRFGSALNLNIHFHMLFLDGAYLAGTHPPGVSAHRGTERSSATARAAI
jgi:hypothetical protein